MHVIKQYWEDKCPGVPNPYESMFQAPTQDDLDEPLFWNKDMVQLSYCGLMVKPKMLQQSTFDIKTTATLVNNMARIFAAHASGILSP